MKKVIILSEEEYDALLNKPVDVDEDYLLICDIEDDFRFNNLIGESDAKKIEMFDFLAKQAQTFTDYKSILKVLEKMTKLAVWSVKQQRMEDLYF